MKKFPASRPIPAIDKVDEVRFLSCFSRCAGCWVWTGYSNSRRGGYGLISIKGRRYYSHRVSYFYFNQKDPGQSLVCHTCDNPKCVNPSHLFLGSHKENMRDMIQKGRKVYGFPNLKGEKHGGSKLKEGDIKTIRALVSQKKANQRNISKLYGISPATVCLIINNKIWRHV